MTLETGSQLGPYEIVAPLGAGGMGEVYRARDKRLRRDVAVKVVPEHLAKDRDALNRFEREAQAVAALSHPNILAIHDVGTEGETSYVVTELLEGETLRERVRRSPIPWRKAVEIGVAIADGLAAAHAKGIIHRDLKPDNIFLTKDGVVKILDFGLARMESGSIGTPSEDQADTPTVTLDTRPGMVLGTVNYMSPEQVRGQKIDARSDIFSFGSVLYEMMTGSRAFTGESTPETMTAILKEDPPGVVSTRAEVIPEVDRVITRCVEKRPEQRIQSARDLAFALRDILMDSGPSKPVMATPTPKAARLSWILVGALAVALVVVLTLWQAGKLGSDKGEAITSLAVLPFVSAGGDPETEYLSDEIPASIILNLARLSNLRVVPRNTAFRHKGQEKELATLGRELKVEAILTGRVAVLADSLIIHAELIDVANDKQLWGTKYRRTLADILAIEEDIAKQISDALRLRLTYEDKARLAERYTDNAEAHRAYMQGRFWWNKRTAEGFRKAIEFFDEAIRIDPAYALAYAGKADAYIIMGYYTHRPSEVAPLALEAAETAIRLDPTLAESYPPIAWVHGMCNWDWEAAEEAFRKAIELNPRYATAHHWYGVLLLALGRFDEAEREINQARQLDPGSLIINREYASVAFFQRDFDLALRRCRHAVEMDPMFAPAHKILGDIYLSLKRYDEAIAEFRRLIELEGRAARYAGALGYTYGLAGRRAEALEELRILGELSAQGEYVPAGAIGMIHAGLGNFDAAFEWLDKSCDERDNDLALFKFAPNLDVLRTDPRFDALVRRLNMPPDPPAPVVAPRSVVTSPAGKIMLAVLPFENLGLAEDEYFADGISDEIRSRLAAVRKLGVISRASAFQYKEANKTSRQIGSELGIDYLIDGTIRWDRRADGSGRVRITPELIRISDDMTLWSQPYNRVIEDIFEVQADIAEEVISQLRITLLEPERQAIEVTPTESTDAYSAYLRGLDYAGRPDYLEEDCRLAIQMFERAVSLDPDFAIAYAQLSKAHSAIHHYGYDRTAARAAKAKVDADRALELQPDLPEAYLALGYYHYWCKREYDRALEALSIAEKDLPNDARILEVVGWIWRRQGRFKDALVNMERAFELSPLSASSASDIAYTYTLLQKYAQANRWYDRSILVAQDQVEAYRGKAKIYWLWHGDRERARATLEVMPRNNTPFSIFAWFQQELFERNYQAALDGLAITPRESLEYQFWFIAKSQLAGLVYRLMGEPMRTREAYDSARIVLEKEIKKRPDDHRIRSSLGIVYAGLGRKEEAIREGKLGIELFPVSKDALIGPFRVEDLAFIYVLVGEYDAALDKIEYLLSIPSLLSVPLLRLDPRWDPLRDHPRFQKLIEQQP